MKIFLIGYMGSGKTTAGKKLASRLGYTFIDHDELLVQKMGKSIQDIFDEEGEDKFRELEHHMLVSLMAKDNVVISTGGGTPCHYENMDLMNRNGLTIYLKMSAETLVNRLRNAKTDRPLISGKSAEELYSFIVTHLENREPFYAEAQYKVKAKDLNIDELADFIRKTEYDQARAYIK
jgi:shikimate kinase